MKTLGPLDTAKAALLAAISAWLEKVPNELTDGEYIRLANDYLINCGAAVKTGTAHDVMAAHVMNFEPISRELAVKGDESIPAFLPRGASRAIIDEDFFMLRMTGEILDLAADYQKAYKATLGLTP